MLRRRMLIMLGVVLLIVLVLAGYKAFSIYTMIQGFSAPKPPISVAVATATERPWQARLPTVGTLKALQGVDLSLETDGTVVDVQFESGQKVKAGQPIVRLDSAVESALLETAKADLGLAQVDYTRGSQLVGSQAISKGEFDRLSAVLKKSKATVNQLKAALGEKEHPRAVQRHHRHSSGGRRRLRGQRHHDRHPARPQQPLRRLFRARAIGAEDCRRATGADRCRGLSPVRTSPAPSARSTRKSRTARATCRSARPWPTPTASCCRACSPACRCCCPIHKSASSSRKARSPIRSTATRCTCRAEKSRRRQRRKG
jgi:pyruvate/2-oxoglutarate dehydrogenase complex dihydrolipoamide acyltransferase (E2) component